jgi:hypothetical protein
MNTQSTKHERGELLVGEHGDGPILRLLQNPLNQLTKLSLFKEGLNDHHVSALLQAIQISQVEVLDVSDNFIKVQGC